MTETKAKRYIDLHFSYFGGPDDGVLEFQRVRIVKTRKPHTCAGNPKEGRHEIPAGTECVCDSAKYDGQCGTCWMCLPCLDAWDETREESAESYGYQRGSCPRCHRTCWSDTSVFECSHCGLDSGGDEPEEEDSIKDEDGDELPFDEREADERV